MGSFHETCSASGLRIWEGDEVVQFAVIPHGGSDHRAHRDPALFHFPVAFPMLGGRYNDYGAAVGIQEDTCTEFLLAQFEDPPDAIDDFSRLLARRKAYISKRTTKLFGGSKTFTGPDVLARSYFIRRDVYDFLLDSQSERRNLLDETEQEFFTVLRRKLDEFDTEKRSLYRDLLYSRLDGEFETPHNFFYQAAYNRGEGMPGIFLTPVLQNLIKAFDAGEDQVVHEYAEAIKDHQLLRWAMEDLSIGWTPRPSWEWDTLQERANFHAFCEQKALDLLREMEQ